MFRIKPDLNPSRWEAVALTILILAIIGIAIIGFDSNPHVPIIISILILLAYGMIRGLTFRELQDGMVEGAQAAIGAIFLFFFIGILISSWLISGTIPTLMDLGLRLVVPHFYYAIIFIITSITGLCIGSSLTTAATIGATFIGISAALDLSLPITAGAIVSGAFFGDKMSPLSDTTNLAASIADVDLFEHIKDMGWTTIPAFIITLILFAIISPSGAQTDIQQLGEFRLALKKTGFINWYSIIPLIILILLSLKKVPAIIALAISSISAVGISFIHMKDQTISSILDVLHSGYVSQTGNADIDALLTRGGIESMMFTVSLILLALSMGGLLFKLGIIPRLLSLIESKLNSVGSVITAAAVTGFLVNLLTGEQYLSIILTGETYKSQFGKARVSNENLSRVLEDAGTVVNPLVPWGVCGTFLTNVLGVPTIYYAPFAFFCLLCPMLTILYAWTGWTIKLKD